MAKDPSRAGEVQGVCTQASTCSGAGALSQAHRAATRGGGGALPRTRVPGMGRPCTAAARHEDCCYEPLATRVDRGHQSAAGCIGRESQASGLPTAAPAATPAQASITIEEFARIDLRIARVEAAERVEGADKLLKLTVDLGGERRTVFAGIRQAMTPRRWWADSPWWSQTSSRARCALACRGDGPGGGPRRRRHLPAVPDSGAQTGMKVK